MHLTVQRVASAFGQPFGNSENLQMKNFYAHHCQVCLFEVFCGNDIEGRPKSAQARVREASSALGDKRAVVKQSAKPCHQNSCSGTCSSKRSQSAVSSGDIYLFIPFPKQAVLEYTWAKASPLVWTTDRSDRVSQNYTSQRFQKQACFV